jgi:hypothetical protein
MCKPMLVTLPFVLLLLDYWPLNRLFQPSPPGSDNSAKGFPSTGARSWKKFLCWRSRSVVRDHNAGTAGARFVDIAQVPFWTRMGEAPVWFVIYLGQMIWPAGLAVIYTHFEESLPWWPAALALLGFRFPGIFLLRGRYPYLWMGWLWNLGMLAPVSGIVQISRHARADHYNYLPQIGLYVGLTWARGGLGRGVAASPCGAGSRPGGSSLHSDRLPPGNQTSYWRDSITLWTHTLECTETTHCPQQPWQCPVRARANRGSHRPISRSLADRSRLRQEPTNNLGNRPAPARADGGRHRPISRSLADRSHLRRSPQQPWQSPCSWAGADRGSNCPISRSLADQSRFTPKPTTTLALPWLPAGADARRQLPNIAKPCGSIPLTPRPTTTWAMPCSGKGGRRKPSPNFAKPCGSIPLSPMQTTTLATPWYREALRINPAFAVAHDNLGKALFHQGRMEEGIAQFRAALQIDPTLADAHYNLGIALLRQGRMEEAIEQDQKALELQPANVRHYQNNLAWMLATAPQASLRNGARALELALKASQASGGQRSARPRHAGRRLCRGGKVSRGRPNLGRRLCNWPKPNPTPVSPNALRREIKLYQAGHSVSKMSIEGELEG